MSVDLTSEMATLWGALGPPPPHRGRVVMFVSADGGEGTSTVAREFARLAAVRARRPVWLIDADLTGQTQARDVAAEPERFGGQGKTASASPDGSAFFVTQPSLRDRAGRPVADARLLVARPCLGGRLWVTQFRGDLLRSGQRARALPTATYWDALRRHAETVVIDAPAADRADTAATLAPFADATVLVVAAGSGEAGGAAALRDEIEQAGGRVAGLVFNRAEVETPRFLRRLAGR